MPRRKRILCVEDHPETCEFIQALLSEYEIVGADTLAEGMRRAAGGRFDLYLLDYHLPDGTGLELCSRLRAFNRKTPILIYSGTNFISHKPLALKCSSLPLALRLAFDRQVASETFGSMTGATEILSAAT